MAIAVHKQFFSDIGDVYDDMKASGLWPATYVSDAAGELPLHWHEGDVTGYVMQGGTYLLDHTGARHDIIAGDKFEIAGGTIHAEGEVTERTVYLIGTATAGNLRDHLALKDPDDASRPVAEAGSRSGHAGDAQCSTAISFQYPNSPREC